MKTLVVIPARGGSKGIPRKNLADLGGKPLIAHSIEAALRSGLADRIVVSTEDQEIAEAALRHGAEVPFLRPDDLARDDSNIGSVTDYTHMRLAEQGYRPRFVVTLYPTHPFRPEGMIAHLIGKLRQGYSPVRAARGISHAGRRFVHLDPDGSLRLAALDEATRGWTGLRSYGLFHGLCMEHASRPYLHVEREPQYLVDIDTPNDLERARRLIEHGLVRP